MRDTLSSQTIFSILALYKECWACLYLFKKRMFAKPQNLMHKLQFQSHTHSVVFHGARLLFKNKNKKMVSTS